MIIKCLGRHFPGERKKQTLIKPQTLVKVLCLFCRGSFAVKQQAVHNRLFVISTVTCHWLEWRSARMEIVELNGPLAASGQCSY